MQYVIHPVEMLCLLDRGDVCGSSTTHTMPLVARRTAAVHTRIDVGDVVADRTQPEARFHVPHGDSQRLSVVVTRSQDVKRQALRALRTDSRQLLQFIDQPRHRLSKFRHVPH